LWSNGGGLRKKDNIVAVGEDMGAHLILSERPGREGLSCPIVVLFVQSLIVFLYFLSYWEAGSYYLMYYSLSFFFSKNKNKKIIVKHYIQLIFEKKNILNNFFFMSTFILQKFIG
jgi:hypothetical protein